MNMNKYGWLAVAALCGALVALRVERRAQTWLQRLTYVLCGLAFSFFVTPLIASHWHINETGSISAIGFLMAMCWQNIYNRFLRGVEDAKLPFEKEPNQTLEILDRLERMQANERRKERDHD